ncbi:lysozyme [Acetobacteraceae bacterium ESL0709]|nr:lysozyme [Acetobacteraceae bacterium ESL0697]MDF7677367.1 lysozyme [Acetobacteraceae bacterium ESL0709]
MKDETSRLAFQLISTFEGCSLTPYLCPAGHWTIGYGMTFLPDGTPVTRQTKALSQNEADTMLEALIGQFSCGVTKAMTDVTLKPCQKAALISFASMKDCLPLRGQRF